MKLQKLKIQNFMAIGQVTMDLENQGLVLVLGENKDSESADSNGAAKTACLDALCWCLWGTTTRGLAADEVVHRIEAKDCEVELSGEVNGEPYRITRYRKSKTNAKPNDLRVFVGDKELTQATMADTQVQVTKLIGLDYATFAAMMPGSGMKATELTDKEIKALLESILQTEHFAEAYKLVRETTNELAKKIALEHDSIDSSNKKIAAIEARLTTLADARDKFDTKRAAEVASIQFELSKHQEKLTALQADVVPTAPIKTAISVFEAKVTEYETALTTAQTDLQTCEKNLNALVVALAQNVAPLDAQIAQLAKTIAKTEKLGPSCNSCLQDIPKEHTDKVLSNAKTHIERLEASKEAAKKASEADQEFVKKQISSLLASIKDLKTKHADMQKQVREHAVTLQKSEVAEASVTALATTVEAVKASLEAAKNQKFEAGSLMDELVQQAASLASEVSKHLKVKQTLSEEEKVASFWQKAFSPSGIRSFVLTKVVPVLNERAKFYADILTNGEMTVEFSTTSATKKGEDREYFQIKVEFKNGADTYQGCSAGEKARADLVVSLALGDLASMRSKHGMPFRFIDEAFEKMDTTGVDAVVRLLKRQEKEYQSVFVVTHKKELQDHFDRSITMVKHHGRTTMRVN